MGYNATSSVIKQGSRMSTQLFQSFMEGSLGQMSKSGSECFKVVELDETEYLQWDDEMSNKMHTCMFGDAMALANEEEMVKQEGTTFMDEQATHKFGFHNCATRHVCKNK
eukprot:12025662-Ditylum_brightwellii.AAC.1